MWGDIVGDKNCDMEQVNVDVIDTNVPMRRPERDDLHAQASQTERRCSQLMDAVVVKSKPANSITFGALEQPNMTSVYQGGNCDRVFQGGAAIGAGW